MRLFQLVCPQEAKDMAESTMQPSQLTIVRLSVTFIELWNALAIDNDNEDEATLYGHEVVEVLAELAKESKTYLEQN